MDQDVIPPKAMDADTWTVLFKQNGNVEELVDLMEDKAIMVIH